MDRLPSLRLLTVFDAVQRLGSMKRAAAELNVTRPAMTQAIRALEAEIGVPLMDRSRKPAVPTEAGERLARATRQGLAFIADALEDIRFAAGVGPRQLTVSCTLGFATHWLMPRLSQFYTLEPEVMVNIQAPASELPNFAIGVDIALRYGREAWTDGETIRLFPEDACPVGRPHLIAKLGDGADFRKVPLIHVRTPPAYGWAGWPEYFAARGLGRPSGPKQIFDNYIQAAQAAVDGRGVMLGWHSITDRLVADGTLVALEGAACDFGTAYWATCARDSLRKSAARAFMDWIASVTERAVA